MKWNFTWALCILNLLCWIVVVQADAEVPLQAPSEPAATQQAGRLIVKFKNVAPNLQINPKAIPASIQLLNTKYKVQNISKFLQHVDPRVDNSLFEDVYILDTDPTVDIRQAASEYSRDPHVVYAQPDYAATVQKSERFLQSRSPGGERDAIIP